MKLQPSAFTIAEILGMLERRELFVDDSYQRSPKVWPPKARSFFIDTILEEYPFPKVYFLEKYDGQKKRVTRDIIDGQQRITAIRDFREDLFRLGNSSRKYAGKLFSELPEDAQEIFLTSPVQVDLVKSASNSEILEMFRRMNAYTAPLNPAEKRHAEYQGSFKLFVLLALTDWGDILEKFGIFTQKQLVRMSDAEFVTELCLVLRSGIVNKSDTSLSDMYEKNEDEYEGADLAASRLRDFFELLRGPFSPLQGTFIMKAYVLHSLFCALIAKKYGFPGSEDLGIPITGAYYHDLPQTLSNLADLAAAHETQDFEGKYADYVLASTSTTHRIAQRTTRTKFLAAALV
jgi:hypothetical protein